MAESYTGRIAVVGYRETANRPSSGSYANAAEDEESWVSQKTNFLHGSPQYAVPPIPSRARLPSHHHARHPEVDSIRRMDSGFFFSFIPALVIPLVLVNLSWSVAVIVLLVKIWRRVKHLPAA
jgi:hypothetical protein